MSQYPNIAIKSVTDLRENSILSPRDAWENNAKHFYPHQLSSQKKGCPKSTFLGLCEQGKVKGVKPRTYTKSKLNKQYGLAAIELLRTQPNLNKSELWSLISKKTPNEQMSVVIALFKNDDIQW
jgi:hypothetical protein